MNDVEQGTKVAQAAQAEQVARVAQVAVPNPPIITASTIKIIGACLFLIGFYILLLMVN
jgi:hypothetical protein